MSIYINYYYYNKKIRGIVGFGRRDGPRRFPDRGGPDRFRRFGRVINYFYIFVHTIHTIVIQKIEYRMK